MPETDRKLWQKVPDKGTFPVLTFCKKEKTSQPKRLAEARIKPDNRKPITPNDAGRNLEE